MRIKRELLGFWLKQFSGLEMGGQLGAGFDGENVSHRLIWVPHPNYVVSISS